MNIDEKAIELNNLKRENSELRGQVNTLNEQLKYFIPRRRVRRVYKMLGKILNLMNYNDGTPNEEADERDIIEKQRKIIYDMAKFIKLVTNNTADSIENIINDFERKLDNE